MSEYARRLLGRIEAIDTANAGNQRRAEAYQRMEGELKTVEGTATSPDGVVTVVASAGGEVTGLTFGDRARAIEPSDLSATVMHTIASARADAVRQQAEVVRRGLGDTRLLDSVLDADRKLFGDRPPPEPGPAPAQREPVHPGGTPAGGRRRKRDDDEFFGEFQLYRNGRRR
ncbi:YbaB/EbfC family nucleoid-associated protein [Amycolatopsis sp. NPDC049868]|uniref:YbaB/EbfC family nucleoid-associated protein n=1 Tax=Amycolatopsis sp. NPDC049868 TaxID=3363934 RepID=UPI0037A30950